MKITENIPIFSEYHYQRLQRQLANPQMIANGIFVTFRHRPVATDKYGEQHLLSDSNIEKNWSYFINTLNRHYFGRKYKKKTNRLEHISVEHKHLWKTELSHIHSIFFKPISDTFENFVSNIKTFWAKSLFGDCDDSISMPEHNKRRFNKSYMVNLKTIYSNNVIRYQFEERGQYESYPLW